MQKSSPFLASFVNLNLQFTDNLMTSARIERDRVVPFRQRDRCCRLERPCCTPSVEGGSKPKHEKKEDQAT